MRRSRPGRPLLSALFCASCVGPKRDFWPPRPGEPRFEIDVVFHDRHTVLVEPVEGRAAFREWGYAERAWFLEGKRGSSGAARALLWPTASVLGCEERDSPLWRRHPEEEVERWSFVVSRRGLDEMHAYLDAERGPPLPRLPGWNEGTRAYHLFHHCHHVTAGALRAAGLPVAPWWCLTGGLIRLQLNRVRRIHGEAGLFPVPGSGTRAPAASVEGRAAVGARLVLLPLLPERQPTSRLPEPLEAGEPRLGQ